MSLKSRSKKTLPQSNSEEPQSDNAPLSERPAPASSCQSAENFERNCENRHSTGPESLSGSSHLSNSHARSHSSPAPPIGGSAASSSAIAQSLLKFDSLEISSLEASSLTDFSDALPPLVRPLLTLISDLVYVYDRVAHRLMLINDDQMAAVLGDCLEGLQPPSIATLSAWVHSEDWMRVQMYLAQLLGESSDEHEVEFRLRQSNGEWRWLRSRDRLLSHTPDGLPWQRLGLLADITHQKQTDSTAQPMSLVEQQMALVSKQATHFARMLSQSLDLKDILNTAVDQVLQMFQADRVLIYRLFENGTGSIIVDALAEGCPTISGHPPPESIFPIADRSTSSAGWVYSLSSLETESLSEHSRSVLRRLGVRAMLVVPMMQQDRLWGWLMVHQCLGDRTWQKWETDLITQLAGQLDLAIAQSELYQQVQRLNVDLERQIQARTAELRLASNFEATLKRITDKVRDSLDEDQILQTAVQELAIATEISCCNAALYDLEEGTSTVRYEYTTTVSPYQGRTADLAAFPEIYGPLLNGQSLQFCSLVPNPVRGRVSMLATPIMDDQGVLGDLWMINHAFYAFGEQDLRMAQQVANQCAIALRQSRLFQAAQAQVRELEKLNQLKDDFLSTVSHELRTPMSNIKMAIQMLELILRQAGILDSTTEPEPNRVNRYFKILREESQREISLINDLLDLSRLDAGADALHLSSINLAGWLIPLLRPFEERTRNHQQSLQIRLDADSLPPLITDLAKLERVVTELLTNACKYTPAGGEIWVEVKRLEAGGQRQEEGEEGRGKNEERRGKNEEGRTKREERKRQLEAGGQGQENGVGWEDREEPPFQGLVIPKLQIRVTNTGTEIPLVERDRIFEKFYRIPNNDPWKYGGTGLGLALVKKLVMCLQGTLELDCADGQVQFTVTLPLQPE
ncbi:GAF domain-containing protein [Thermoleptolyngbya sichuanensis XZ-Cy5]|nr:GAF domain-containing protein [Thermoleptolyngbya sichuanensis XZ-Cy5]